MKFIIVCGGSAGHINPAIAIAEELRSRTGDAEILFIGADKILEKKLIPAAGFNLINIKMSGLRRKISPKDISHNIKTIKNLMLAGIASEKILKKHKPDAVIGTGGYISYPVIKKAIKHKIPTFLLEPNALPGLAVRMLNKNTTGIFVTYPGTEHKYKRPERVIYTGTPLKKAFIETAELPEVIAPKERPLVISYWGSLGAPKMNTVILDFIKQNIREKKFDHIHAAGAGASTDSLEKQLNTDKMQEANDPLIEIRDYIDDMPSVMKRADIVISRSGASTIAEQAALGKPSILIPSPNVTENHQEENAKRAETASGAVMILENDCTGEELFNTVLSLLENKEKLHDMKLAQRSLFVHDASVKIVDTVLKYCNYDVDRGEAEDGGKQKEKI